MSRKEKFITCIGITLVLLICLLACSSITVFPTLDRKVCLAKAANSIGVSPTYDGIRNYVEQSLVLGISHDESLEILRRIAPIKLVVRQSTPNNLIRETYQIQMCSFPLNNIIVLADFDQSRKLHWVTVVTDFP